MSEQDLMITGWAGLKMHRIELIGFIKKQLEKETAEHNRQIIKIKALK